jgi:hypothetical protein
MNAGRYDGLKKKLRSLKKLEAKLRFGAAPPVGAEYVWDTFFDLHDRPGGKAKYSIRRLGEMAKPEFHEAIGEYFFSVYYRLYRESGLADARLFDPEILGHLGLGYDADAGAVKKRFHELALKYHPDTGGDAAEFIELMDNYRKLIDKRR